jgi:hypothetical protein
MREAHSRLLGRADPGGKVAKWLPCGGIGAMLAVPQCTNIKHAATPRSTSGISIVLDIQNSAFKKSTEGKRVLENLEYRGSGALTLVVIS